jgi:hypothetical protein
MLLADSSVAPLYSLKLPNTRVPEACGVVPVVAPVDDTRTVSLVKLTSSPVTSKRQLPSSTPCVPAMTTLERVVGVDSK